MKTQRDLASGLSSLRRVPAFASYPETDLKLVAAMCECRHLKKGARLCRQGEPASAMFVLDAGIVKLTRGPGRRSDKVIQILYPHSSFAESVVFSSRGYPVSAIALGEARVLALDASAFAEFLRARPERMADMIDELGRRLEHWMGQVERLGSLNAAQKVASYLLERSRLPAVGDRCGCHPPPAEPRMEMASLLAIRPETLSRTIRDFRQKNLIGIEHGEIVITNSDRLAAIAEEAAV